MQKIKKAIIIIMCINIVFNNLIMYILNVPDDFQGILTCILIFIYAFSLMYVISKTNKKNTSFKELVKYNALWLIANFNALIFMIVGLLIISTPTILYVLLGNIFIFFPLTMFIWIKSTIFKKRKFVLFCFLRFIAISFSLSVIIVTIVFLSKIN